MGDVEIAVASANAALGVAYVAIGMLIFTELARGWRSLGPSHFGVALSALAFTCGPHHVAHAVHVAIEGRPGMSLDLSVVTVGLVPGALFVLLRLEALLGGRGDRFISGTPRWLAWLPPLSGVYVVAVAAAAGNIGHAGLRLSSTMAPNVLLVALYTAIAAVLLRGQRANREREGGWSLSGLSLAGLFATCAVMHAVFALYTGVGTFEYDLHGAVAGWASVPAAVYFLWVAHGLQRGRMRDWNLVDGRRAPAVVRSR